MSTPILTQADYRKAQERVARKQAANERKKLREQARKLEFQHAENLEQCLDFIEKYPKKKEIDINYVVACSRVAAASEYFGNKNKDKDQLENAKECAQTVKEVYIKTMYDAKAREICQNDNHKELFFKAVCTCLDILARQKDFDSYLLAREFFRPNNQKFYMWHRRVMMRNGLIQVCQKLINCEIRKLIIEAPPGTGKSAIGEALVAFLNGLDPTARCLIGTAHGDLAKGFYNDYMSFYQISPNDDYRHNAIFGNVEVYYPDGDRKTININKKAREPQLMISTVEKGSTGQIHVNEQGIVYLDDVIPGVEVAENPDRLGKMNKELDKTFLDRRENSNVRFLGIATPWSKYDYFAVKKKLWAKDKKFVLHSTPAYYVDKNGVEKTNFDYDGSYHKTMKYWREQMGTTNGEDIDPISSAKYLMKYIDTDGTPFNADNIKNYYTKLPERKPDRIIAFGDVATAIDGDYFSFPVGYVYEQENDLYVHDWVCSNAGIDKTRPRIVNKIIEHKITAADFEVIDVGKSEVDKIRDNTRSKGHICNIRAKAQIGKTSKRDRILARETSIKGLATANGSYNIWFLDKSLRKGHTDYNKAMELLFGWSDNLAVQKSQVDDPPDSLAGLLSMVDGTGRARVNTKISLRQLGL